MPLSDHEKRMLAEMEAALVADDPKLVSTLNGRERSPKASKALLGFFAILGGIAVLFAGLIAQVIALGIAGFLVSLAGLVVLLSNLSFGRSEFKSPNSARPKWSSRLEDRWERRNFDN
ncbi:unannotated protein [freshwater metagenome]|jgi:hypothetical protein|uniref:Unannotated protein n=1 Tax=freshwater metagenome TaxID=449393 RepID=A0A6J6ST76_9ZZZZ|nr:DUF3040 domain-containing protein [Actinomycetota bacterium]